VYADENLRIFIEQEGNCGLLKILRFSGRNPDGGYYFPSAYASEKYGLTAHVAEPDLYGCLLSLIIQVVLAVFLRRRERGLLCYKANKQLIFWLCWGIMRIHQLWR